MQSKFSFYNYIPAEVDSQSFLQSPILWKQFQDKISKCSNAIVDILFSTNTMEFLIKTEVDFDLEESQIAEVSRIIRDTLLGTVYLGDMPRSIEKKTGLEAQKARELANHIVQNLFASAMPEIKEIQIKNFSGKIKGEGTQLDSTDNVLNLRENKT